MSEMGYPPQVPYRQPRPRGDATGGTVLLGLLGLLITANPMGGIVGGAIGNALGSTPLTLEAAIRSYFTAQGLPVIGFYRLGPRAAQVLFRDGDRYWTITSRAPDADWELEGLDDWLYGDLVQYQLPEKLASIGRRLAS